MKDENLNISKKKAILNQIKSDFESSNMVVKKQQIHTLDDVNKDNIYSLTEIQQSYHIGKWLGKDNDYVGCHIYYEFEEKDLSVSALKLAWLKVMECHEMLRTVVTDKGQKLQDKVEEICSIVYELNKADSDEITSHLSDVRNQLSHKVYESGQWPLFEIRITNLPNNTSIIHFSIDAWIVDGRSLKILMEQWCQFYKGNGTVTKLEYSFREFVNDKEKKNKNTIDKDLNYWMEVLNTIPSSPFMQLAKKDVTPSHKRKRYYGNLAAPQWEKLKAIATSLNVSSTSLLFTLFTETILIKNGGVDFALLMTLYNRGMQHPDIDQVVGPFISTAITVLEQNSSITLKEKCKINQKNILTHLDHGAVSGIGVLRELKRRKKAPSTFSIPIVFTSMLSDSSSKNSNQKSSWLDQLSYSVSQTPQLFLDHQVAEQKGALEFTWDVVETKFEKNEIEDLFQLYEKVLLAVVEKEDILEKNQLNLISELNNGFSILPNNEPRSSIKTTNLQKAYLYSRIVNNKNRYPLVYQEFDLFHPDIEKLEKSFNTLLQIHPVLRATIDQKGILEIANNVPYYSFQINTIEGANHNEDSILQEIRKSKNGKAFPFNTWPLFDVSVTKIDADNARLHVCVDMALADLNSIYLLYKQLMDIYQFDIVPKMPRLKFCDYMSSLQGFYQTTISNSHKEYWSQKFNKIPSGNLEVIKKNIDEPLRRERISTTIKHWDLLEDLCRFSRIKPELILFTAFAEAIVQASGQDKFSIVFVNWLQSDVTKNTHLVIGDFTTLSWIPVSNDTKSLLEKLDRYRSILAEDEKKSPLSGLSEIQKNSEIKSGEKTFPIVFTNLIPNDDLDLKEGMKLGYGQTQTPNVYLDNVNLVSDSTITLCLDFVPDKFEDNFIKNVLEGYKKIVESYIYDRYSWEKEDLCMCLFAKSNDQKNKMVHSALTSLEAKNKSSKYELSQKERNKIVYDWNDTEIPYEECKLMHQLFEEQVLRTPDLIATVCEDSQLTYAQVNEKANQLANYLVREGIEPRDFVGVCLDRSHEMIISVFAIHKVGAAYIPIETHYPEDRIASIVEISNLKYIITQEKHKKLLSELKIHKISLDACHSAIIKEQGNTQPPVRITSEDVAYVIFTSGSTGKPKGVVVQHKPVINLIEWVNKTFCISEAEYGLFVTALGFDLSVYDIYGVLATGGKLYIVNDIKRNNPEQLSQIVVNEGITFWNSTPATFNLLLPFLSKMEIENNKRNKLRIVFLSGDWIPLHLPNSIRNIFPKAEVISLGGATEATVWSNYFRIKEINPEWKSIPYGVPIQNAKYYILDENLNPLPVGEQGDLFIGGKCLSKEYLNSSELTSKSFISNPFSSTPEIIYRTGDLARFYPDGNIEFLGRADFQVKIRGYRIELGEIEHILLTHKLINEVVVTVKEPTAGDQKLVAYYISSSSTELSIKELREFSAKSLPNYMIPNLFYSVKTFPLTSNGKVDKKSLPFPMNTIHVEEVEESQFYDENELIEIVTTLFESEMNVGPINSITDLFEIGATSLNVIRVVQALNETIPNVNLTVNVLLDQSSIKEIARFIVKERNLSKSLFQTEKEAQVINNEKNIPDFKLEWEEIEDYLIQLFKEELNINSITKEEDFFDLGASSLNIIRASEKMNKDKGILIPADTLLDDPSINGIINYIKRTNSFAVGAKKNERKTVPQEIATENHQKFINLVSVFKEYSFKDTIQYLYPAFGGTYPVQVYIYLNSNFTNIVNEGFYYYHPKKHTLELITANDTSGSLSFSNSDFSIFLVGETEALTAIYGNRSQSLVTLAAGYVMQAMFNKSKNTGLELNVISNVPVNDLKSRLKLHDGHVVLHAFSGSFTAAKKGELPTSKIVNYSNKTLVEPIDYSIKLGALTENFQRDASFLENKINFFSVAERKEFLKNDPHIRHNSAGEKTICLAESKQDTVELFRYSVKKGQAGVNEEKVLAMLKRFNHLVQTVHKPFSLSVMPSTTAFQIYVYSKGESEEKGTVYKFNKEKEKLDVINTAVSIPINVHYPFYRSFFKESAFSIFIEFTEKDAFISGEMLSLAQLEAGVIGQILLENQAEFGIGLYPIGDMKFEQISEFFNLDRKSKIVHCILGGAFNYDDVNSDEVQLKKAIHKDNQNDIAIVGLAGRYPKANTVEAFWDNLKLGRECITELPKDRRQLSNQSDKKFGGYIEDIKSFDSLFFNISPSEAKTMDPQERILMEVVWECLEDAGYTLESLSNTVTRTGVFIGATWSDYKNVGLEYYQQEQIAKGAAFHSSLANRISHFFNFKGPSLAIDTSCSSTLSAIHIACLSILNEDCDSAIVAGVNLVAHPYHQELLASLGLLSENHESKAFCAEGTGWVVGEGIGAVLIRKRTDAQNNDDNIQAIIKSTTVGHGGKTARFWMPNTGEQAVNIQHVLNKINYLPADIDYIEAGAQGASLADASEFTALRKVFDLTVKPSSIAIGSVKPSIGHLESAAGISQITKAVLQLKNKQLVPTIIKGDINPLIAVEGSAFHINTNLCTWDKNSEDGPRRILINAFGGTGTSAHVILEEFSNPLVLEENKPVIIVLSARSENQLQKYAIKLADYIKKKQDTFSLNQLAKTLQIGRKEFEYRIALVCSSFQEIEDKLSSFAKEGKHSSELCFGVVEERLNKEFTTNGHTLNDIANRWIEGYAINWESIYTKRIDKISLPTYPFEKVSHWLNLNNNILAPIQEELNQDYNKDSDVKENCSINEVVQEYLIKIYSEVSEINIQDISPNRSLEEYGISSIIITKVNSKLEASFGELPKTLFFEYFTIKEIANYLVKDQFIKVKTWLGDTRKEEEKLEDISDFKRDISEAKESISKREEEDDVDDDDIVIVGLAGRYPKSDNIQEFWSRLLNGEDCISEIPKERWDFSKYESIEKKEQINYNWGGFINDIDKFDPLFFNISPKEAMYMDPQERLFLETSWKALEDAGLTREKIKTEFKSALGVYVGVTYGEYQLYGLEETHKGNLISVASFYGSVANRLSYFLGATGPSMAIDTMCASSLTSLHLAVESLRRKECLVAIAGGVNSSIHPNKYVFLSQSQMLSPKGRCASFGDEGAGYVPGEGIGAVVLMSLGQAKKLRCPIYARIKGSSVNHGGKTNGYYVPNPNAQSELIGLALKKSGISPATIGYMEAHGTGTALGDPIEITGLKKAFEPYTSSKQFCAIGSVKSNIGHLEAAAGIAGLSKVLLQLKYKTLVPSIHSTTTNQNINFKDSPFYVQQTTQSWEPFIDQKGRVLPRRAAISSFGAGGSNAHVIVEEFAEIRTKLDDSSNQEFLFILSARIKSQLDCYAKDWIHFLEEDQKKSKRNLVSIIQILEHLLDIASSILNIDKEDLDMDEDYSELGFDALNLRDLIENINAKFGLCLTKIIFTEYSNLGALGRYLDIQIKENNVINSLDIEESNSISDICYTQMFGREEMEERLAVVIKNKGQLLKLLQAFVKEDVPPEVFSGKINRNEFVLNINETTSINEIIDNWIKGGKIDWNLRFKNNFGSIRSLPTYPFIKERYWLPKGIAIKTENKVSVAQKNHPFYFEEVTSEAGKTTYSMRLSNQEFYLKDHLIGTSHILPGVAYIEMALEAFRLHKKSKTGKIHNIVWISPIIVNDGMEKFFISFVPADDSLDFAIHSRREGREIIHGQGKIALLEIANSDEIEIKINDVIQEMTGSISTNECYALLKSHQLNLGTAFQVIKELYFDGSRSIAKLEIEKTLQNSLADYYLHPTLLDGSLQSAIIGLFGKDMGALYIPFAIGTIEVYERIPDVCYAIAQLSPDINSGNDKIKKFNVLITDINGKPVVRINEFVARPYYSESTNNLNKDIMYYTPVWKEKEAFVLANSVSDEMYMVDSDNEKHKSLLLEKINLDTTPKAILFNCNTKGTIVVDKIDEELEKNLFSFLDLFQALSVIKAHVKIIISFQNFGDTLPITTAIKGFINALGHENKNVKIKTVTFSGINLPSIEERNKILRMEFNAFNTNEKHIDYKDKKRLTRTVERVYPEVRNGKSKIRTNGVYLLTGGAGGLGRLFGKYLEDTYQANVIFTDIIDPSKTGFLFPGSKGISQYIQCDITNKTEVAELIKTIQQRFGTLHGIVHCAGTVKDNYAVNKVRTDIKSVISTKVTGTVLLDECTSGIDLDFIVLFSSLASEFGNPGQSDYAYANCFLDEFSSYRNALALKGLRKGKTVAINWSIWKDGGLKMDPHYEKLIESIMGVTPMDNSKGLASFEDSLFSNVSQFMVMHGNEKRFDFVLFPKEINPIESIGTTNEIKTESKSTSKKIIEDLKEIVFQILKVDKNRIDLDADLNEYGFNSIELTQFANSINDKYNLGITPALFFELTVPSINEVAYKLISLYPQLSIAKENQKQEIIKKMDFSQNNPAKEQKVEESTSRPSFEINIHEDIAIVGMSGVMPKSENLDIFWEHLLSEKNLISEIPADRWDWKQYDGDPQKEAGKTAVKWGGFMPDLDKFDSEFFGISPREAELMDPQQRIFIQTVWKAIENAGYNPRDFNNTKTGLFVGVATSEYIHLIKESGREIEAYTSTGMCHSITANRISFLLGLRGPSEPIDTACSSSLVAIDRAVNYIRSGKGDMAIVGGVNALISPDLFVSFSKAGMLSKDGKCKTFDHKANGYVRGEGVAAFILKPLSKALKDKDYIHGLIKGSAVNHGGRANSLTAPNANSQADVLISAYENAGVNPASISYIEAHGTGTSLGDPIEINGIKKAFTTFSKGIDFHEQETLSCGIGSVKSNIGHLETAAGMAGLIKVLYSMKHSKIPGNLHFQQQNPYIELENTKFKIIDKVTPWEATNTPRRAGISSFGFGGVNAHIVVEDYINKPVLSEISKEYIFILSTRSEKQLQNYASAFVQYLNTNDCSLSSVCYTLQVGREAMDYRLAVIASDKAALIQELDYFLAGKESLSVFYEKKQKESRIAKLLLEESEGETYINLLFQHGKSEKIAQLWVMGCTIPWKQFYIEKLNRIPLPTYPFEKVRHWIDNPIDKKTHQLTNKSFLHELVHENVSTIMEQRYKTTFSNKSFYLEEHKINGTSVLPGVIYIEMIRVVCVLAFEGNYFEIKDLIWLKAIEVIDEKEIFIRIIAEDSLQYKIQITSNSLEKEVVHAQASVLLILSKVVPKEKYLAIPKIIERLENTFDSIKIYGGVREQGLDLGDGFTVIKEIHIGQKEALSRIVVSEKQLAEFSNYTLHPSLMDGAFQTAILLGGYTHLHIPYEMTGIHISDSLSEECFVYVTETTFEKTQKMNSKFNISLLNKEGKVLLEITDFYARALFSKQNTANNDDVFTVLEKIKLGEVAPEDAERILIELI